MAELLDPPFLNHMHAASGKAHESGSGSIGIRSKGIVVGRKNKDAYHQYKQVRDLLYDEPHWDCHRGVTPQFVLDLIVKKREDIYEQLLEGQRGYESNPLQSVAMLLHRHSRAMPNSQDISRFPFVKLSSHRERPRRFSLRLELLMARRASQDLATAERQIATDKLRERRAQRKAYIEAWEGAEVQRLNNERERGAVAQAFKQQLPHYRCEACHFDFEAKYGPQARGYIEAHHKNPLSNGKRQTTIADFNAVCSNCHSMLHWKGLRTAEQLRRLIALAFGRKRTA